MTLSASACLLFSFDSQAIVINDDDGAVAAQVFGQQFSAVVRFGGGCSGVLIAPDIVLTARHCSGGAGMNIFFGADSSNPIYTVQVASAYNPAGDSGSLQDGGDLRILQLAQSVPDSIATPLKLASDSSSIFGLTAAMVGYGYNGVGSEGHQSTRDLQRWAGTNVIETFGSTGLFFSDFDNANSGANTISTGSTKPSVLEATTATGDSGGPLLVESSTGEWLVAGVLSGGSTNTSVYGDRSFWTSVSPFQTEIESLGGVFSTSVGSSNVQVLNVAGRSSGYHLIGDGSSTNEVTAFRSSGVAKTFDIDGDNVYGTAGTFFTGNGEASNTSEFIASDNSPAWATITQGDDYSRMYVASNQGPLDDPGESGAQVADWGAVGYMGATDIGGVGDWSEILSILLSEDPPDLFRLGIIAGTQGSPDGRWDPTGIRISADGGKTYTEASVLENNGNDDPNFLFFDINLNGDDTALLSLEVSQRVAGYGGSITGLTFDVFTVPEPSSLMFLGLGGLTVLRRRRR